MLGQKLNQMGESIWQEQEERQRVLKNSLESEIRIVTKDIDYLKKSFDYVQSGKAEKKELDELWERIRLEIEPKAEVHEVQTAINAV